MTIKGLARAKNKKDEKADQVVSTMMLSMRRL
jgi:hypothetical protein